MNNKKELFFNSLKIIRINIAIWLSLKNTDQVILYNCEFCLFTESFISPPTLEVGGGELYMGGVL